MNATATRRPPPAFVPPEATVRCAVATALAAFDGALWTHVLSEFARIVSGA